jgi:hypothetical protein
MLRVSYRHVVIALQLVKLHEILSWALSFVICYDDQRALTSKAAGVIVLLEVNFKGPEMFFNCLKPVLR